MKKLFVWMFMLLCTFALGGCKSETTLSPAAPVTLTMWHVYGEQAEPCGMSMANRRTPL